MFLTLLQEFRKGSCIAVKVISRAAVLLCLAGLGGTALPATPSWNTGREPKPDFFPFHLLRAWIPPLFTSEDVSLWLGWTQFKTDFYSKALPIELQTVGFAQGTSEGWFMEACGGVVFQLSEDTLRGLRKDGIAYLASARQGRGYPNKGYYSYAAWHETPVPHDWISEGMWLGLDCADLGQQGRDIFAAATAPGSYYTTKDEAELLVIPSLRIVVLTYYG